MDSPEAFLAGIGKGTGGLMKGIVGGAITSTTAIIGSASKGVAQGVGVVSGDRDFVRKRDEKRRMNTASTGGVLSGMMAGSESFFSGFVSGISGLVTRPIAEGKKGGALGFMKGIGLGVAGVVTKPILGVTDGLASLVHGISNQVSDSITISLARPPRAFDRSATDVENRVLVPLDLASGYAQEYILRAARKGSYSDSFVSHMSIDGSRYGSFATAQPSTKIPVSDPSSTSSSKSSESLNTVIIQSTRTIKSDGSSTVNNRVRLGSGSGLVSGKGVKEGMIKPQQQQQQLQQQHHLMLPQPYDVAITMEAAEPTVIADGSSVILSEMFVYVLRKDGFFLGRFSFGEMSHCSLHFDRLGHGVNLVLYQATECVGHENLSVGAKSYDFSLSSDAAPHLLSVIRTGGKSNCHSVMQPVSPIDHNLGSNSPSSSPASPYNTAIHEGSTVIRLKCKSKGIASKLYAGLSVCAPRMGNPSSVLPPDVATATATATAPATATSASSSSTLSTSAAAKTTALHNPLLLHGINPTSSPNHLQVESIRLQAVRTYFQEYRFGTANKIKHTVLCPEKEVLQRGARRFTEACHCPVPHTESTSPSSPSSPRDVSLIQHKRGLITFAQFLDARVWQLVGEWTTAHKSLQASRCLAVLIINESESPVQILKSDVLEGRNIVTFGVDASSSSVGKGGKGGTSTGTIIGSDVKGYDEESHTLHGCGGAAVVFSYGFLPTLIDPSHVEILLVTSAFSATLSTKPNRTTCAATGGYTAGYLEKSRTEAWAKYVILVS